MWFPLLFDGSFFLIKPCYDFSYDKDRLVRQLLPLKFFQTKAKFDPEIEIDWLCCRVFDWLTFGKSDAHESSSFDTIGKVKPHLMMLNPMMVSNNCVPIWWLWWWRFQKSKRLFKSLQNVSVEFLILNYPEKKQL